MGRRPGFPGGEWQPPCIGNPLILLLAIETEGAVINLPGRLSLATGLTMHVGCKERGCLANEPQSISDASPCGPGGAIE